MRFQCPACKGIVSVEDTEMGNSVQCGHCSKMVTVPSSRMASGSVIGDFIILHELGRGGMGIVYLAHQISLDRPAALKILSESYAKNSEFVVGFIKEARAAAKLNHPNIVQAYAVGDDDGIFYFAMEHIDGETMKHILKRDNVIPVDQAVDIVRQIAEALDYAWQEEKLVHRDIKPDNIMLTSNGRAKLADLGLAKVGNDPGSTEGEEVMGTPQYISPEQLTGDPLDNRTDIYCLGATFYHFLTGRFPYEGASAVEIARQHLDGTLIPPNQVNPNIPEAVSRVVEKMMAKDPAQRYQNAGQLAEDLALIKRGQNPTVATISGSIRVQSSNRNESVNKVIPPKLRLPGKTSPQGTETIVDSKAPRSAPKLSLPGQNRPAPVPVKQTESAPKVSVKAPALKKTPTPPKAPSLSVPPPPVPSSPQPAAPAEEKKTPVAKKKKKNVNAVSPVQVIVKIVAGIIFVAALLAGGTAAYLHFVKKQNPLEVFSEAKEKLQQATAAPEPSEFMKAAGPVVNLIRNPEGADSASVARQCYAFLKKQMEPDGAEEEELMQEITSFFVRQDEGKLETERIRRIEAYEAEQERKRIAAENAARRKLEEERRAQEREAERRLAEAERLQKQRAVDSFKARMAQKEHQMILDVVRYAEKQDAEGLQKLFERNIAEQKEAPREMVAYTRLLVNRARYLQNTMKGVWEWDKIFNDGDPRLAGLQIELRNNLCTVTKIENGLLHVKTFSGKEFSVPVKDLIRNRKFMIFAVNAGIRLQKKDTLPFYFFWMGEYLLAQRAAQDASPRGRSLYSAFVTNYLREAVKDPRTKAQLARKFRDVQEYQRMFPPPRRPPARKIPSKPVPKKKK